MSITTPCLTRVTQWQVEDRHIAAADGSSAKQATQEQQREALPVAKEWLDAAGCAHSDTGAE